jgi:hypothetical protein
MRILGFLFLILTFIPVKAQDSIPNFTALDSLYREDQFYFSFTYNIFQRKPDGVRQNKFSSGLSIGFLRDMPFNKPRTWAIAAGLGYSINNLNQNILITRLNGETNYELIPSDKAFETNKIILHYAELPIEIRWRTSTPASHRFWRVYTGFKVSYLVYNKSKYIDSDGKIAISKNDDYSKFLYGAYLSTGYNTWNVHLYYALNPVFKDAKLSTGAALEMQTLNIGLIFYIL